MSILFLSRLLLCTSRFQKEIWILPVWNLITTGWQTEGILFCLIVKYFKTAGAQLFMWFPIFQCGWNHDGKISFDATRGIYRDQNKKCVRFGKYVKKGKHAIKLGQENKKGSNLRLIFESYYKKMSNCQHLWFICHFYVVHFKSEIREEKNSTILDVFSSLEQV